MSEQDDKENFISLIGKRSDKVMLLMVALFVGIKILSELFDRIYPSPYPFSDNIDMMMWVPVWCFLFPGLHYLCQEVLRLREQINQLERKLAE